MEVDTQNTDAAPIQTQGQGDLRCLTSQKQRLDKAPVVAGRSLKLLGSSTKVTEKVTKDTENVNVKKVTTVTTSRHAGEKEVKTHTRTTVTKSKTRAVTILGSDQTDSVHQPQIRHAITSKGVQSNSQRHRVQESNRRHAKDMMKRTTVAPSHAVDAVPGKEELIIKHEFGIKPAQECPLQERDRNRSFRKEKEAPGEDSGLGKWASDKGSLSVYEDNNKVKLLVMKYQGLEYNSKTQHAAGKETSEPVKGLNCTRRRELERFSTSFASRETLKFNQSAITENETHQRKSSIETNVDKPPEIVGNGLYCVTGIEKVENAPRGETEANAKPETNSAMSPTRQFLDFGKIWTFPYKEDIPKRKRRITCYKDYLEEE